MAKMEDGSWILDDSDLEPYKADTEEQVNVDTPMMRVKSQEKFNTSFGLAFVLEKNQSIQVGQDIEIDGEKRNIIIKHKSPC